MASNTSYMWASPFFNYSPELASYILAEKRKKYKCNFYYHTMFKRSFTVLSKYSSFSIISPVHNLRFAHSDQSPSWRTELGGVLISGLVRIGNRTGNVPPNTSPLSLVQGSHSDWKTWKNEKAFSSQGILNRLEKSGKITRKYWKIQGISDKILFVIFIEIFKWIVYYLLKWIKFSV